MWRRGIAVLLLFLLWAGVVFAEDDLKAEVAQVDTSKYPLITLYIGVHDREGHIVAGLERGDFQITEDGKEVEIVEFKAGSGVAISTVLTVDKSNSMSFEGKMEGAKAAAQAFVDLMRAQDKAALVAFSSEVTILQPFTSDKAALREGIAELYPEGCTVWYDAVYDSVELIARLTGRRSVILLSDGMDCREDLFLRMMGEGSEHTLEEAIARAREANIPVYAIGFGERATPVAGNEGFDEVKLRRVADETGGKYYHAPDTETLKKLYRLLSEEMQKEYVITYKSPRPTYDGTRRNIVVSVRRGGTTGATTKGRYVEKHLINIRSNALVGLAFLLPLLLALALPTVVERARRPAVTPSSATNLCPYCHRPLLPGARFCDSCGRPLAAESPGQAGACRHCGAPLRPGAKFCGRCGKPV